MTLTNGYHEVPGGKLAAVVTSFEMFAPPEPRPDPPAAAWLLRSAAAPGSEWYRGLFRRIGADYLWASRLQLSDTALRAILDDPLVEVYALRSDERDDGILELDFRIAGECELTFFGVGPALLGTGAARWLFNRALERVWSRPLRRFWVHTCSLDHPAAPGFYLRSGFRPFKREVEIFNDPRASGIYPAGTAPGVPLLL
ncbi:MAG: GNAT family N-acetyltransferase [Candidatus Velthaea sp.]|jgi:GNAT superfamily N-acetyltransferase